MYWILDSFHIWAEWKTEKWSNQMYFSVVLLVWENVALAGSEMVDGANNDLFLRSWILFAV